MTSKSFALSSSSTSSSMYRSKSLGVLAGDAGSLWRAPPLLGQRVDTVRGARPPPESSRPTPTSTVASRASGSLSAGGKEPNTARVTSLFEAVITGIRDHITATDEDLRLLQQRSTPGVATTTFQQLKSLERHKKKLELHLGKLEELQEHYMVYRQMLQGVNGMAKAFGSYRSLHQKNSLAKVNNGHKECIQILYAIEAQLDGLLGTFEIKIQGLVGFARLIPGDIYKITVRHGAAKHKARCRIYHVTSEEMGSQSWRNNVFNVKASSATELYFKAVEVRSFARTVLLGQKKCDTCELYSATPQLLMVTLNASGSVKLNCLITWNPLDGLEDTPLTIFNMPTASPQKKRSNVPQERTMYHSMGINGRLWHSSMEGWTNVDDTPRHLADDADDNVLQQQQPVRVPSPDYSDNLSVPDELPPPPLPSTVSNWTVLSTLATVEECMRLVRIGVEATSRKPDNSHLLDALLRQIDAIEKLIESQKSARIRTSSAFSEKDGTPVEVALGAFDFLESEDSEESPYQIEKRHNGDHSPKSTLKTRDSGIECLSTLESGTMSYIMPPAAFRQVSSSTGQQQVDTTLAIHLSYICHLLKVMRGASSLGWQHANILTKLTKQTTVLEHVVMVTATMNHAIDIQKVLGEITVQQDLRVLWVLSTDDTVLFTSTERLVAQLSNSFADSIRNQYNIAPASVFWAMVRRMQDLPDVTMASERAHNVDSVVTVYQFLEYLLEDPPMTVEERIGQVSLELWVRERLISDDADVIVKTVTMFGADPPPGDCLYLVVQFLLSTNVSLVKCAVDYLIKLRDNVECYDKVVLLLVEELESTQTSAKLAALKTLQLLRATPYIHEITYVRDHDSSSAVRKTADGVLRAFEVQEKQGHGHKEPVRQRLDKAPYYVQL